MSDWFAGSNEGRIRPSRALPLRIRELNGARPEKGPTCLKKNMMQHVDKISYGIAAVVGLAILVLPFLSGGKVDEIREDLNDEARTLKERIADQTVPVVPDKKLASLLRSQWNPGTTQVANPRWLSEAAPTLVKATVTLEDMKRGPRRWIDRRGEVRA